MKDVNLMILHDYTFERINRKDEKETLDKQQIVRKFSIEDKLEIVAIIKTKTDLKQQSFRNSFKTVKDLRDDIIYFKKMDNNINQMWRPIIESFFDSDLQGFLNDIVSMIGYLNPQYLTVESWPKKFQLHPTVSVQQRANVVSGYVLESAF
jgi:hypothetical protein